MLGFLKTLFSVGGRPAWREIVWLSTAAKLRGVRAAAKEAADAGRPVLVVSHFPDVLRAAEAVAEECGGTAASANDLPRTPRGAAVLVCERHPHPAKDDALAAAVAEELEDADVQVHSSLDDPVLKVVVTDAVRRMLDQVGMEDDEAIESAMVGRRIRLAQEKLFGQTDPDACPNAGSAEEWVRAALADRDRRA